MFSTAMAMIPMMMTTLRKSGSPLIRMIESNADVSPDLPNNFGSSEGTRIVMKITDSI